MWKLLCLFLKSSRESQLNNRWLIGREKKKLGSRLKKMKIKG